MIKEFKNVVPSSQFLGHHEQTLSMQTAFKKHVLSVVSDLKEPGNRFEEQGDELIAVHTRDAVQLLTQCKTFCKLGSHSMIVMFKKG